jgi:DNA helicase-2/ATP-dependent DNA helicase PcrA
MQELLNGAKEFTDDAEDEISLADYLEKIALLTDIDSEDDEFNKVTLMTIHSAKGLEFEHCFIVGLEENLFPSQMSIGSPKDVEEERRLFYVALTRAKKSVHLTYALSRRKWGNLTASTVSRFVEEIDSGFIIAKNTSKFSSQPTQESTMFANFTALRKQQSQQDRFSQFKRKQSATAQSKASSIPQFEPDNPRDIKSGTWVLHAKFGRGFVESISGTFPDSTAVINFENGEQKRLLLKFAKLKEVS